MLGFLWFDPLQGLHRWLSERHCLLYSEHLCRETRYSLNSSPDEYDFKGNFITDEDAILFAWPYTVFVVLNSPLVE